MPELVTKRHLRAALRVATMRVGLMTGITFSGLFVALVLALGRT